MVNGVERGPWANLIIIVVPRIQVAIPSREATTGYLEPDSVARSEVDARRAKADREPNSFARFDEANVIIPSAVPRPHYALVDVKRPSIRMNIDEFRSKVGVRCGGGRVEDDFDSPGDFQSII